MDMLSLIQVIITFLIALFSIIPEFKANSSRNRERRTAWDKLILFARRPLIRIMSLIVLVVAMAAVTNKISEKSDKRVNDSIQERDQRRELQTFKVQNAITDKLDSMGYQYDSINSTLVRLRDSIKKSPETIIEKPLLTAVFKIDSTGFNTEDLVAELRMGGANAKSLIVYTSIAAIDNGKPILIYDKHKAFANGGSVAKDIIKLSYKFNVTTSGFVSAYVIYLSGNYTDMNKGEYPVEEFILVLKKARLSGELYKGKIPEAKAFFKKGTPFTL